MRNFVLAIAATTLLAACAGDHAARRVTGSELQTLYAAGVYDVDRADGDTDTVTLAADGTASMRHADGRQETARWRLVDDRACFTWSRATGGRELCGEIWRRSDGRYVSLAADGSTIVTYTPRR